MDHHYQHLGSGNPQASRQINDAQVYATATSPSRDSADQERVVYQRFKQNLFKSQQQSTSPARPTKVGVANAPTAPLQRTSSALQAQMPQQQTQYTGPNDQNYQGMMLPSNASQEQFFPPYMNGIPPQQQQQYGDMQTQPGFNMYHGGYQGNYDPPGLFQNSQFPTQSMQLPGMIHSMPYHQQQPYEQYPRGVNSSQNPFFPDDVFTDYPEQQQHHVTFDIQSGFRGMESHFPSKRRSKNDNEFLMFDSSNYEEDDDEDYSIQEDLLKNKRKYKFDEEDTKRKYKVPKQEVNDLKADLVKDIAQIHPVAPLYNSNSRSNNLMSGPSQFGTNLLSSQTRKRFPENIVSNQQQPRQAQGMLPGEQSYRRIKPSGNYVANATPIMNDRYTNNLVDHVIDSGTTAQLTTQQQTSQPLVKQNNYYYNFNNNFSNQQQQPGGGIQQLPPSATLSTSDATLGKQNIDKQVKSIEIQVTPEKLQEGDENNNESKSENNGGKKKRRRRKAEEDPNKVENDTNQIIRNSAAWAQLNPQYYTNGYFGRHPMPNPYQGGMMYSTAPMYQYGKPPVGGFGSTYQPYPGMGMPMSYPIIQQPQAPQFPLDNDSAKSKDQMRDFIRIAFYPFQNDQLKEVVHQIELYIQMLYQVLLYPSSAAHELENGGQVKQPGLGGSHHHTPLTRDQNKYRAYCLLYDFQSKKEQTLKPLNLPKYKVNLSNIRPDVDSSLISNSLKKGSSQKKQQTVIPRNQDLGEEFDYPLEMNPQVSFYQSPLLEIAPEIIKQLQPSKDLSAKKQKGLVGQQPSSLSTPSQKSSMKQVTKFLKRFEPLINPYLLPILKPSTIPQTGLKLDYQLPAKSGDLNNEESKQPPSLALDDNDDEDDQQGCLTNAAISSNNNRRKFSAIDDHFLLLGLRQYGYKDVDSIKTYWLPSKTTNEIKHRYKNLTCAKAQENIIKHWKNHHGLPLTPFEERQLARAVRWFGPSTTNRWPLISKCFLPNKNPHLLKMEYQNIVQDHARAEHFGKLMLEEIDDQPNKEAGDTTEDKGCSNAKSGAEEFEDIDLDKLSEIEDEQEEESQVDIDQQANDDLYVSEDDKLYEEIELL